MKRLYSSLGLSFLMVALVYMAACAPKTMPPSVPSGFQPSSEVLAPETASADSWQAQWESAMKEGKKEAQVVIYTTQTSNVMRQAMVKAVNDKYGIKLDVLVGKGVEIASKIFTERNAQLFAVDIYFGGPTTPLTKLKPAGFLIPLEPKLILPEVIDPKNWLGGKLGWIDREHYIIGFFGPVNVPIAINTLLVKPEEMRSYYDLLNPKWKGKIVINDPTTAGTGASGFAVLGWDLLSLDFFYQLAKQEPVVMRDRRLQVEWIARGKYAIQFFPNTSIVAEFRDAGAPLALITPREGTYVSSGGGGLAMMERAPHPSAAKVFVNWVLSKEGQTLLSRTKGAQSLRIDVTTEGLDPMEVRQEGVKYSLGEISEEFILKQPERMEIAQKIFAPFIVK